MPVKDSLFYMVSQKHLLGLCHAFFRSKHSFYILTQMAGLCSELCCTKEKFVNNLLF